MHNEGLAAGAPGSNWPVTGYNGGAGAQLSQPRGSTLIFLFNVGVSCAIGSRHAVTMHPRGRHSREGMIVLPQGADAPTVREQQPQPQLQYYDQQPRTDGWYCARRTEKAKTQVAVKDFYLRNGKIHYNTIITFGGDHGTSP